MTDLLLILIAVELAMFIYYARQKHPTPPAAPLPSEEYVGGLPKPTAAIGGTITPYVSGLSRVMRTEVTIPKRLREDYGQLTDAEKGEYEALQKIISTADWTPCEFVRDYTPAWQEASKTIGMGLLLGDGTFIAGRSPH